MSNPLLEKYEELNNPKSKKVDSLKSYNSSLGPSEEKLIKILEKLIDEIREGKSFFHNESIKEDYRRLGEIPMSYRYLNDYQETAFNKISYDTGMIYTIEVFRSYDHNRNRF